MTALLPCKPFAQAKAQLSDVMSDVVRSHHPYVVDRHQGKEQMVLIAAGDLRRMLERFPFKTQVSVSAGEFIFRVPELNLTASGDSFDSGLDELVEVTEAYAHQLIDRFDFYMQTDLARQIPWALRFALTPAEERRDLLVPRPERSAADETALAAA
jgi:hypothetical protein